MELEKVVEIAEANGWAVHTYDDCVEFSKYSPADEDFSFTVSKNYIEDDVQEYVNHFNAERHASMWRNVECRSYGAIPYCELVDDADAIKVMLKELADAVKEGVPHEH